MSCENTRARLDHRLISAGNREGCLAGGEEEQEPVRGKRRWVADVEMLSASGLLSIL